LLEEAEEKLDEIFQKVKDGETILLLEEGKAIAKILPFEEQAEATFQSRR
jgi:antitoxin (DNA-binding transcriptional repressor) of toxin-antitoxin stability system